MAFLSSFRIGQQTVYPEALYERLKSFALLENVGDAALRNLLAEANWFALPGGTLLERGGENNAALFLVVTGSLGVFVSGPQGQRQMVVIDDVVVFLGTEHDRDHVLAEEFGALLRALLAPARPLGRDLAHPDGDLGGTQFLDWERLDVGLANGGHGRLLYLIVTP